MSTQPEFTYKEIDSEGHDTLDVISLADNFNQWMYETIQPFCQGDILEIGSGTGNISNFFLSNKKNIFLSDIRDSYCEILQTKFSSYKNLLGVQNIDLIDPSFDSKFSNHLEKYNTVFALNVVEHIENDSLAIANCKKMLKSGGRLIILVPAYQSLYNRFDEELFHYKRYNKSKLGSLFLQNDFTLEKQFYFNALGIAGWYVSGKLMRKKIIPKGQMSFYNKIVPIAKILDLLLLKKIGLSVISVGRKH